MVLEIQLFKNSIGTNIKLKKKSLFLHNTRNYLRVLSLKKKRKELITFSI